MDSYLETKMLAGGMISYLIDLAHCLACEGMVKHDRYGVNGALSIMTWFTLKGTN